MRTVVSEAFLRDEISARMNDPRMDTRDVRARPEACPRQGDGPNWTFVFNPAAVPAGYSARWESIRTALEARYDLDES
jgi:hypothetical protein